VNTTSQDIKMKMIPLIPGLKLAHPGGKNLIGMDKMW
jgi:hypothetical protein